jgi:hypothetical protein
MDYPGVAESIASIERVAAYIATLRPTKKNDIIASCEGCEKEMTAAEVDAIPPCVFDPDCLLCLECAKKEMKGAMEFASFDFDAFVPKRKEEKPTVIPYEDDKFKWDYDDKGVLCRYNKETQGWEVMEECCDECGHLPDECDCGEEW